LAGDGKADQQRQVLGEFCQESGKDNRRWRAASADICT